MRDATYQIWLVSKSDQKYIIYGQHSNASPVINRIFTDERPGKWTHTHQALKFNIFVPFCYYINK